MGRVTVAASGVAMLIVSLMGLPVSAQEKTQESGGAGSLFEEGADKILKGLRMLIEDIPQYESPEVQPNGDIIIRRMRPQDQQGVTPPGQQRHPQGPGGYPVPPGGQQGYPQGSAPPSGAQPTYPTERT